MTNIRGKPKIIKEGVTDFKNAKPGDIAVLANGDHYIVMETKPGYKFIDLKPGPGARDSAYVRSFTQTGLHQHSELPNIVKIIRKN
jgi:hypothetical protein